MCERLFFISYSFYSKIIPTDPAVEILLKIQDVLQTEQQLRKVTKSRSIFPFDDLLLKMLYLATQDLTKKWTQNLRGLSQILAQLSIHFEIDLMKARYNLSTD